MILVDYSNKLFISKELIYLANYNLNISEKPNDGEIQRSYFNNMNKKLPYAIIETTASSNGTQTATNYEFLRRFSEMIRRTGLFAGVTTEHPFQKPENSFLISIHIDETNNPHTGRTIASIGLAALTYGVSLLVDKKKDSFSNQISMNITRFDGATAKYFAKSSGDVKKGVFSNHDKANTELIWQVLNYNLCSICNQMVDDYIFFIYQG
jgi:hypothetical protein